MTACLKNLVLAVVAVLAAAPARANDNKVDVCAKYETEDGWSKGYKVRATIISGSDLNQAVGSFTRFRAFSTYITIFWDQDEVTILELPALSMGAVPIFATTVKDQSERNWRIKAGHDFCY